MSENLHLEFLSSRHSKRDFTDKKVPKELIEKALNFARTAASSQNEQPWECTVFMGDELEKMRKLMDSVAQNSSDGYGKSKEGVKLDFGYQPKNPCERWQNNYFTYGEKCYGLAGIERSDKVGRLKFIQKNWRFFNAPVEILIHMPNNCVEGSFLGCGAFIQNLLLSLHALNLGACAQITVGWMAQGLTKELNLPEDRTYVCGIAVGYPTEDNPINTLITDRNGLEEFVTWRE